MLSFNPPPPPAQELNGGHCVRRGSQKQVGSWNVLALSIFGTFYQIDFPDFLVSFSFWSSGPYSAKDQVGDFGYVVAVMGSCEGRAHSHTCLVNLSL